MTAPKPRTLIRRLALCFSLIFGVAHRRAFALPLKLLVERREPSGVPLSIQWNKGLVLCLLLAALSLSTGCAGYQFGHRSLYAPDIRTVHVPIFESNSFRRNLGERLTEAIVREIHLKTPYKVVSAEEADSVLYGRITNEAKRTVAEDLLDNPRIAELSLLVQADWQRRNGEPVGTQINIAVPDALRVAEASQLIPEAGQSIATAQQDVIDKVAQDIVAQMEMPW